MVTVFKYKQKTISKVFVFFITTFSLFIMKGSNFYLSFSYYFLLAFSQVIIYLYYLSKRLIVTEAGIEEKIFWNIFWNSTKWEEMEEASVIPHNTNSTDNSWEMMMKPFSVFEWFAENSIKGTVIKIIVTNREALYLNLREIKNGSELYEIIEEKVRFVRT